jgi:hypothetical protein
MRVRMCEVGEWVSGLFQVTATSNPNRIIVLFCTVAMQTRVFDTSRLRTKARYEKLP